MIDTTQTLGTLAAQHPEATQVFLRHRLDFCCGGQQPLQQACDAAGLDAQAVAREIEQLRATHQAPSWHDRPLPEIVEFIVSQYHEPLRRDLPALIEAARRVERVHRAAQECPHGLSVHLGHMDLELRQHMSKEEMALFPALLSGTRGARLHMPVRVMMQEHDDHAAELKRLRELTRDFEVPPQACATWRGLYAALQRLEEELMQHIHLENNVLFPRALAGD